MEQRMLAAARKGNIHELDDLIGRNEQILEEMALEGAGHTPLHVACVSGHLDFVRELLKHMPKLTEKVKPGGFSPLHIAAARGDVEIAVELLKVGTHLCSVKGWERRIPLHYAVINGEVDVMEILLSTSPESVEETTAREETALHLAVKNHRFKVLVRLVEHLKRHKKEQLINWKDHKGNTALHLAATNKNFEVVDFMLRGHALASEVVEVNALNESGLTPLDVSTPSPGGARDREIREILTRAGAVHGGGRSNSLALRPVLVDDDVMEEGDGHQLDRKPVTNAPQSSSLSTMKKLNQGGESLGDIRNALLVVAALIVSATYQSVLQPPKIIQDDNDKNSFGGFGQINYTMSRGQINYNMSRGQNENNMTRGYRKSALLVYGLFLGGNTSGFFLSVQMIICLTKDLPVRLPLMLSLIAMVLTYFSFTISLLFTSVKFRSDPYMLRLTPLMISAFLLLIQKWLAVVINFFLVRLFQLHLLGDMYKLEKKEDSENKDLEKKDKCHYCK
ncbi:hypothetical protein EUGRSUZ_E01651 [Eucalyptus grandis]|uniref:Uncharacterized protein n=2 Tax=Eucalyptus grandis TaxID=71139 RepID=A0ACC3KUK6_EUCGR|nr:hypothetical protein EUGRSUZ_E01651 [Eucalyptus grandis]